MASRGKKRTGKTKVKARAKRRPSRRKSALHRKKPAKAGTRKRHSVTGSERPVAKGAVWLHDANPKSHVDITITLRGPRLPALNPRRIGPASTSARSIYGISKKSTDKVASVLRKHGLKVVEASPETRSMRVRGTVAQMEAVFHPGLGIYESADLGRFRDRESNYKVPAELRGIIKSIVGFGERRVALRRRRLPRRNMASVVNRLSPLGPDDIESLYNFPAGNAKGCKIVIAELGGGYIKRDLRAYCSKFGRRIPKVRTIPINMPVRTLAQVRRLEQPGRSDELGSTEEVMMDVQIVAGLCPAADIQVYFATFDQKGWVDLLDRVIKERPVAVSVSWGQAEDSDEWSKAAIMAINERLHAAALLGITICCASGDDGTGDEQTDGLAHVDFPSSSPHVLAVGGTMLDERAGKIFERVWWQYPGRRTDNGGGSTGGGVSGKFTRERWQRVRVTVRHGGKSNGRVVPDIAALAGPPWYDLVYRGRNSYGGGTSASAPVLASLIARVYALLPENRRRQCLTPLLYHRLPHGVEMGRAVCRDITEGHNASRPKPGFGYEAGAGFDAVSGWGVPIGAALLLALQSQRGPRGR
jgi:kumamolisin